MRVVTLFWVVVAVCCFVVVSTIPLVAAWAAVEGPEWLQSWRNVKCEMVPAAGLVASSVLFGILFLAGGFVSVGLTIESVQQKP